LPPDGLRLRLHAAHRVKDGDIFQLDEDG
jgi:hypothetical protein